LGLILDSSVLIAAERRMQPVSEVLAAVCAATGFGNIMISAISVTELEHGIWRADTAERTRYRRSYIDEVYAAIPVQPFTKEIGHTSKSGPWSCSREQSGRGVPRTERTGRAKGISRSTFAYKEGSSVTSLRDLHDATLKNVSLEWQTAIALLTFKIGIADSDVAIVEAKGVTNLNCPRLLPWGPSSSVNSAGLEEHADGRCLTIEMQSGDFLESFCREIEVKQPSE
jgi:hypothetical protein